MRVLLVRPPAPNDLSFTGMLDNEPLELEYLHTGLMHAGYEDQIFDYICENKPFRKVLASYRPDVVAITGYLTQENVMKRMFKDAKKFQKSIVTIVGGVHAQLNYERFYDENIDFIARSESVEGFVDLIRAIEAVKERAPIAKDFREINGLCFRDKNGEWIVNPYERIDIDSLPIPDRSFFYKHKHRFRYLDMTPMATLKTSFSCPFDCKFCYCTLLNKGAYQARDLELVIEELKGIEVDNIQIVDDDFLVDKKRLWEFIRLVKENGIRKTYTCYARADFVSQNEDIVKALVEIGFKYFLVGLEATSDKELLAYNKRTNVTNNEEAVRVINGAGGECIALMIVGIEATKEDFDRIYDWVVKNQVLHVTISIFTPIPGTPLYEEYKHELISDNIEDWDFLHLVVRPRNLSKRQFYRYYRELFLKLYKRARKAGLYQFLDLQYFKRMLSRYLLRKIYLDR
ncbi:MAG: radical SAM protein [Peptostreptococcaceae bacterium]|nr:radical SAM protein [Peptostreptococcaceae bacterium]